MEFYQTPPHLENTFVTSRWLKKYLLWRLPKPHHAEAFAELDALGRAAGGFLLEWAREAERQKPQHVPFDPWGRRVDDIRVARAWDDLKAFSAREGMLATGYERRFGEHSRMFQFAKLFLFHPSSAFFTCPLAMADGAARVLEIHGRSDARFRDVFRHLTSREPKEFWTSGQWMTERTGGSDVSGTSTVARASGDSFLLSGVKWFSSATTSEMALGLARVEGAPEGSRGLTLFYIPMRENGPLSGVEILRLKDKLGTHALPTAELRLQNARAYPIGEFQQGVKTVATMLNVTRLYNSVCALGSQARCVELLEAYGRERQVFGKPLAQQPLFQSALLRDELEYLASFVLTFRMTELLGKDELKTANELEGDLLRLFTPITKLFTAKAAVRVASETVEGFGGAGYIEDTGVPTLFRDSQVFSIWEGATNVLSLDVLRVLDKTAALKSFFAEAGRIVTAAETKAPEHAKVLRQRLQNLQAVAAKAQPARLVESARALAFYLAHFYAAVLLLEWEADGGPVKVGLSRWLRTFGDFELEPESLQDEVRQFFDGV